MNSGMRITKCDKCGVSQDVHENEFFGLFAFNICTKCSNDWQRFRLENAKDFLGIETTAVMLSAYRNGNYPLIEVDISYLVERQSINIKHCLGILEGRLKSGK